MRSKRLFSVLAMGIFLFLPYAECVTSADVTTQAMQCCRTMPCTPANKTYSCCKTMIFAHAPNILPVRRVSLATPTVVAIDHVRALDNTRFVSVARVVIENQQHSPPALYTLNVSLLI